MNDCSTRTEGKTYVYAIGVDGGPHKIGTAVDVRRRLDFLQTANHCDLSVAASVELDADEAAVVERYAHQLLLKHHRRGEWFDVPAGVAGKAIEEAVTAVRAGKRPDIGSVDGRGRRATPRDGIPSFILRAVMATARLDARAMSEALGCSLYAVQCGVREKRLTGDLSAALLSWSDSKGYTIGEHKGVWRFFLPPPPGEAAHKLTLTTEDLDEMVAAHRQQTASARPAVSIDTEHPQP